MASTGKYVKVKITVDMSPLEDVLRRISEKMAAMSPAELEWFGLELERQGLVDAVEEMKSSAVVEQV